MKINLRLFSIVIFLVVLNFVFLGIFIFRKDETPPQLFSPFPPEIETLEQPPPEPGKSPIKDDIAPTFIDVPKVNNYPEDSVYGDIMAHSREAPFGNAHGRGTNVHETTHGLNSWIRNKYGSGKKVNGFYVLKDRGVVLDEPNFRKHQIAKFVPQILRSYRFSIYLSEQGAWDATPTYIYDEWVCYVNSGRCDVDDVQTGRYKGTWVDGVSGALEFSIYAVATAMAAQECDPQYWQQNAQHKAFLVWMLREAQGVFMDGRTMSQFKWDKQDKLLREFLTNSTVEPMRRFVRENLEGVWLDTDVNVLKTTYESYQCLPYSLEVVRVYSLEVNRVKFGAKK